MAMANSVKKAIDKELPGLERRANASRAILGGGIIIVVRGIKEAAELSNRIAPEHLKLFVKNPKAVLGLITNADAVFLGRNTPEAAGDYLAGPNHTLPTEGSAHFSSPLSAGDFMKRTSVIGFSAKGIKALGRGIRMFAEIEGLTRGAHALSVKKRLKKQAPLWSNPLFS